MGERNCSGDDPPVHGFDSDATPLLGTRPARPARNAATTELAPGRRVGGYEIEARRAGGGFATVYRARDAATGRRVALKVLHAHLVHAPSVLRRFGREADLIARLAHRNIVRLLGYGELDELPYLVMEWVEGATLAELLADRGPLSLDEVIPIIEPLVAALEAAHAIGVVHRDLKASNVALAAGEVKLLDFGIAKLLDPGDGEAGITTSGTRLGTPHYMAPEQIRGGAIDQRVDVYALGILVFEMLTGRRPFDGPNPVEIEERQLRESPPCASRFAAVGPAIDGVIQRAMAKDPARRPGSAAELLHELRAACDGVVRAAPRVVTPAVAFYVHAGPRSERAADDVLDRLDRALAELRRGAAVAGFELAADARSSLLFVAAPGTASMHALIGRAEQLAREASAAAAHPDVLLALTIHAAELEPGPAGPGAAGGTVFDLAGWTRTDASGVFVTRAARVYRD